MQLESTPQAHSGRLIEHNHSEYLPPLCSSWGHTGVFYSETASALGTSGSTKNSSNKGARKGRQCVHRHYFVSESERNAAHDEATKGRAAADTRVLRAIARREALLEAMQGADIIRPLPGYL